MRNLKKILALVLALVMSMSLVSVASAADFSDKADIEYQEAVEVLYALEVIDGVGNNTFNPDGNVTRAQMAKMITIISLGNVEPSAFQGTVTDLKDINGHWAEAYIKYCYSQGIIAGKGNGIFDPNANVTCAEAAKMLLVAIGYNSDVQGYEGAQWAINVQRDATAAKFYTDLSVRADADLTRDQAAQLIYNAVDSGIVEATPNWNASTGTTTYEYVWTTAKDLLSETFDVVTVEGYLDDASYNPDTKKFTYGVDPDVIGSVDDGDDVVVFATTDFSALAGQKVKALYKVEKDGTKTAYGIYSTCTTVSATVGELDLTTTGDDKIKLAGTEYKLEGDDDTINVYVYTAQSMGDTGYNLDAITDTEASSLTLVDNDKNGKYDYALVLPVTVEDVTYVGTKSITVRTNGSLKFEDHIIYDGAAKEDIVMTVAKANSVYDKAVVTKLDAIEGTVNGLKGTDIQIDGVWYKQATTTITGSESPAVGDTVAAIVVGNYYYDVEVTDGKSLENVLMLLDAGLYSEGLASGAEAKVMYADDGEIATVKISKVKVSSGGTMQAVNGVTGPYTTAQKIIPGGLYTYEEKNGALELTVLADDVIGSYDFDYDTNANAVYNATIAANPVIDLTTPGDVNIADDAVVMVYTGYDSGKTAYITGAQLKTWNHGANWGDDAYVLHTKVNGIDTAKVIALYEDTANLPATTGSTGYGYVTEETYYTKVDGTSYAVMTLWTADGELKDVKAESGNTNGTPSATTVKNDSEFLKGAFVSFEKLSNGNIQDVTAIGGGNIKAVEGIYTNTDGETVLNLTALPGQVVTKDTVVIYIDASETAGAEGGKIAVAEEAEDGSYIANVVSYCDGTPANEIDVLFVDVNNDISNATVELAVSTDVSDINDALNENGNVVINGNLTSGNELDAALDIDADETLTINGDVTIGSAGSIDIATDGKLVITGTLTLDATDSLSNLTVSGTLEAGKIDASPDTGITGSEIATLFGYTKYVIIDAYNADADGALSVPAEKTLEVEGTVALDTDANAIDVDGTLIASALDVGTNGAYLTGDGKVTIGSGASAITATVADTKAAPKILSVTVAEAAYEGASGTVTVTFDKALDSTTVASAAYTFSGGPAAASKSAGADGKSIEITIGTAAIAEGDTLTISGIESYAGVVMGTTADKVTFGATYDAEHTVGNSAP